MSRRRGGKRIRVRCFEQGSYDNKEMRLVATRIQYPHSARAKKFSCNSMELPIIDTGFHRPSQCIKVFLNEAIDKGVWSYADVDEVLSGRYWENIGRFLKGGIKKGKS